MRKTKLQILKVKIGALLPNPAVLEIRPVNPVVVSQYRQHMRAGAAFPVLEIIAGTMMLVCGHHRLDAYRAEFGDDYEIEVKEVSLKTEAEVIERAVSDNIKHGLPMDGISRRRAIIKLATLGRTPNQLAQLFGIAIKRVEAMGEMCVMVRGKSRAIKRGMEHMAGTTVKPAEYEAHEKRDRGVPAWQNANQLTRWIENGWIDMSDAKTISAMEQLQAALSQLFAENQKG